MVDDAAAREDQHKQQQGARQGVRGGRRRHREMGTENTWEMLREYSWMTKRQLLAL